MWGRDSRKARLNHELRLPPASAGSQALRHTARRALSYKEALAILRGLLVLLHWLPDDGLQFLRRRATRIAKVDFVVFAA